MQPEPSFRERASKAMVGISRDLRQRQTSAESLLWEYLRDRRLEGIKFRRQHAIANSAYVADFYCYECRLVIELDGGIHDGQAAADTVRQQDIVALGNKMLRFRNDAVFDDPETVLATILARVKPSP